MAEVKWIKIVTDIFDDEKILLIETLPEADSIIVIWFKLLCLAGKQNNSGVFILNDKIPYTDKMLATIFRRKETIVALALQTFEKFGMIELINGVITIPKWSKHQTLDQIEERNQYMKEYMQKYREKQRLLTDYKDCKVNSKLNSKLNVNTLDKIRIEEDKNSIDKNNKKKNNIKEKKETEYDILINSFTDNDKLKNTIYDFIKMRKTIKKPLSTKALELLLNKLVKLEDSVEYQIMILENSIMNCWQGIFELKDKPVIINIEEERKKQKQEIEDMMKRLNLTEEKFKELYGDIL